MRPAALPITLHVSVSLASEAPPRGLTHDDTLFLLLDGVHTSGSLAEAARALGLSYRHAWGMMRAKEAQLEAELIGKQPGRRATLTAFGRRLLWTHKRMASRFAEMSANLASEFRSELCEELFAARETLRLRVSHDPLWQLVHAALEQQRDADVLLDLRYGGGEESLQALAQGTCDAASLYCVRNQRRGSVQHLRCRRFLRPRGQRLIRVATRIQGLMLRPALRERLTQLADVPRLGYRFVNRQKGSATRLIIDQLLREARVQPRELPGYEIEESTHLAAAARIAAGQADVGVGTAEAARELGLEFVPLLPEDCFLLVPAAALEAPRFTALIELLQGARFRGAAARLTGYDVQAAGTIEHLDEALPWA